MERTARARNVFIGLHGHEAAHGTPEMAPAVPVASPGERATMAAGLRGPADLRGARPPTISSRPRMALFPCSGSALASTRLRTHRRRFAKSAVAARLVGELRLIAKVLSLRAPARVVASRVLNWLHGVLRTGNARHEFESLYLVDSDPWDYQSSSYEQTKYERTLACILARRRASNSALECGSSIGAFTARMAAHFSRLTAVDFSREALRLNARRNRTFQNIRYVEADLRSLDLRARFDVIVCAEVLYYIFERDAEKTCRNLQRHLAPDGILVAVSHVPARAARPHCLDDWEAILDEHFLRLDKQIFPDPLRPYHVLVYSQRP